MKIKEFYKKYNIKYLLWSIVLYAIMTGLYYAAKFINQDGNIQNWVIDDKIPFVKEFIIFYFLHYFLPALALWITTFYDKSKFWILWFSAVACLVISFITYCIYQVEMVRPEVTGNDIFSKLVRFVYKGDIDSLNCFPSIHAIMGAFAIVCSFANKNNPLWMKIVFTVLSVGIIVSTVFVKQHYFYDALVGVILMFISYPITYLIIGFIRKKSKNKSNEF